MNKNISTFIACDAEYDESKIVLFGAPFDSTTSYRPGTRFGSSAIRNESFGIETYSPYTDRDLHDTKILDAGDLELCMGSSELALKDIEEYETRRHITLSVVQHLVFLLIDSRDNKWVM